jgi:hypothetical protein
MQLAMLKHGYMHKHCWNMVICWIEDSNTVTNRPEINDNIMESFPTYQNFEITR